PRRAPAVDRRRRADARAPAAAARCAGGALSAADAGRDRGESMTTGTVSLVGAGPGDPELLTRRAAARLAEADVVLYDALVDPEVLALAPHARRVFVGKRAGRPAVKQ